MKHWNLKFTAGVLCAFTLCSGPVLAEEKHEIYKLLPQSALSGLIDPNMEDRSSIDKALPAAPGQYGDKLEIGWTEITLGNPWFVGVIDVAKQKAEEYGYDLDVQVADGDPAKTSAQIDTFIARGVDVIVLDPTDLASAASDAERAVEAGIPVIALGTVPDESPIVTTVLFSPYGNGFTAGRYVAEQFDPAQQINAATLIGRVGNSTAESRVNGLISGFIYERSQQLGLGWSQEDAMLTGFNYFQELNKSGSFDAPEVNFSVLAQGVAYWTEEGGLNATETILSAHGDDLDVILAGNDFMGIGAINALENQHKKGEIQVAAAADGFRVALDLVKSGEMMVTALNSGTHTGEGVMKLIHQIFDEGMDANNLPMGSYYWPPKIATKENVDQFIDEDKNNPFFKYSVPEFRSISEIRQ
jgi:ribose transport system substrate-binding protein